MRSQLLFTGLFSLVAGLALFTVMSAVPAYAQSADDPRMEGWRDKWVLGVGFLSGHPVNNDSSDPYWNVGAGADFQVGWMITPRFALMMDTHAIAVGHSDIPGVAPEENNLKVQGVVVIAAQYWTGERFWIKGGVGRGEVRESATVSPPGSRSYDIVETERGWGTLAAVGYELYQGQSIGLNLHARYAGLHSDGLSRANLVLGFGIAWYP